MYQPLPTNELSSSSTLPPPSSTSPPPVRRSLVSPRSCFGLSLILLLVTAAVLFLCSVFQVHNQLHENALRARQWEIGSSSIDLKQWSKSTGGQGRIPLPSALSNSILPATTQPDTARLLPAERAADEAEDAAYYADHTLVPVADIEQQAAAILAQHSAALIPDFPTQLNLSVIAEHLSHYTLLWDFGGVGCSGFAIEASNLLYGLSLFLPTSSLFVIRSAHTCPGLPPYIYNLLVELSSKPPPQSLDILVVHKPAPHYPTFPYHSYGRLIAQRPSYVIGRSMTEVHRVPREWGDRINQRVDECWLTSTRQIPPFLLGGADPTRLWVVGEPLDVRMWDDEEERQKLQKESGSYVSAGEEGSGLTIHGRKRFNFLSVFKLEERKGWKELVYAFMHEFSAEDDVALFIHTYLHSSFDQHNPYRIQHALLQYIRSLNLTTTHTHSTPPYSSVHIVTQTIPTRWLPRFYSAFSAFVLPTHGEGWCLPMAEALLSGLPLLATNASTHLEFVNASNAILIPVSGYERAVGPEWNSDRGEDEEKGMWPTVSVSGLRRAMRRAVDEQSKPQQSNRDERVGRGKQHIRSAYSVEAVAERMMRRLYEITKHIDAKQNRTRGASQGNV